MAVVRALLFRGGRGPHGTRTLQCVRAATAYPFANLRASDPHGTPA